MSGLDTEIWLLFGELLRRINAERPEKDRVVITDKETALAVKALLKNDASTYPRRRITISWRYDDRPVEIHTNEGRP